MLYRRDRTDVKLPPPPTTYTRTPHTQCHVHAPLALQFRAYLDARYGADSVFVRCDPHVSHQQFMGFGLQAMARCYLKNGAHCESIGDEVMADYRRICAQVGIILENTRLAAGRILRMLG